MRRFFKHLLIVGTVGGGLLSTQGCTDVENGLFVEAVLKLSAPACTAAGDSSATTLLGGVLDLAFRSNYVGALLVGNQLVSRGSKDQVRTETARVVLKGSEIRVLDSNQAVISEFTVPSTGFVHPGSGVDPGYGVMFTELIPSGVALAANNKVLLVEVRVFGDTLGGDEITSAALTFPVSICTGCLVSYPADADDPVQPGYQCTAGTDPTNTESPCAFGQDDVIDCRLCITQAVCQTPP